MFNWQSALKLLLRLFATSYSYLFIAVYLLILAFSYSAAYALV